MRIAQGSTNVAVCVIVGHEYFFTIVIPKRSSIAREESAVLPAEADFSAIKPARNDNG